jgi:hypothetical protein
LKSIFRATSPAKFWAVRVVLALKPVIRVIDRFTRAAAGEDYFRFEFT